MKGAKAMRRCRECGVGTIRPLAKPGRTSRYRNARLAIPEAFAIPTCDHCSAEWIDQRTAEKLTATLEQAYKEQLASAAQRSIERISEYASQRSLELLLGLSQGYISKVLSGKRSPSAELVAELALIARDPKKRLKELDRFWAEELALVAK